MKLDKFCCCVDLRKGVMMIAIMGIIASCGFFGSNQKHIGSEAYKVLVSGNVIGLMGNISLLFGAFKPNKIAIIVYLVLEPIQMVLYFAFSIMMFVLYKDIKDPKGKKKNVNFGASGNSINIDVFADAWVTLVLVQGIVGLLIVLIWIYYWLCAFSLFIKVKREERK